ncbi:SubName: Full=Uncharacterized protein {ECO:0000313/EMBL:CCA70281.1} [Serendipita indica DSM 11827]|uniref:Uncharacterized protein n=1 Tax=Serendipita indica (strain DSM 11827) TaxID=1109443 RepID=G4TG23_SERID|nr:SubName: Full=Uncharacterized protein {ECO:0000313/EMBL:CCA70281.1} [Serendipita indica DSM 11827]CCA70281.1 hypothetical protein PIIN_04220 [Serendipita indica DSM 11827]
MRVAAFATLALYTLVAPALAAPIQAGTSEIAARSVGSQLEARDEHPHPRPHHHRHRHHPDNANAPSANLQTPPTTDVQGTSKRSEMSTENLERRNFKHFLGKAASTAFKVGTTLLFRRDGGGPLPPLERRSFVAKISGLEKRNPVVFTVRELD